ncbi:hypothetical protein ANN_01094 [Periplaneta americana]|uniref:Uncharacterized protein n=1 Tax=Periplaneta americana TaxID=6978 RepID=A0ABQ8TVN5_PERAM|nr:hypothetical protein ANN_01094 [Periplaneta americana]
MKSKLTSRLLASRPYASAEMNDHPTNEATFKSNGDVNIRNAHYWSQVSPLWLREVDNQHRLSVIFGHRIIGPYFFEGALNSVMYADFLKNILNQLLEDVPLATRVSNVASAGWLPSSFLFVGTTSENMRVTRGKDDEADEEQLQLEEEEKEEEEEEEEEGR